MKRFFLAAVLAAVVMLPQLASANTLVSTIDGFYGGTFYDTPWLTVSNTTAYDFTNVHITLTGYQGLNNGVVSPTANLPNILAGTTQTDVWGSIPGVSSSTTQKNLFASDYDDEYASTSNPGNSACTINDTQYNVSQYYYCADTGNFYVTLTATWNNPAYGPSGTPIYSQFSPGEDPFGIGNACGNTAACFIGWEGLDPNGWSETVNDDHSPGGPNGVLANIYVGNPPPVGGVPEPATMLLCGTALGLLGVLRRKRA
jgi:hypothetical protein